jgi:hypothetical protein
VACRPGARAAALDLTSFCALLDAVPASTQSFASAPAHAARADLRKLHSPRRRRGAVIGNGANNDTHRNFHPYPQRTFSAEIQYNL